MKKSSQPASKKDIRVEHGCDGNVKKCIHNAPDDRGKEIIYENIFTNLFDLLVRMREVYKASNSIILP